MKLEIKLHGFLQRKQDQEWTVVECLGRKIDGRYLVTKRITFNEVEQKRSHLGLINGQE